MKDRIRKPGASPDSVSSESLVEMGRLKNLSDGVFAIALTLLAFDLRLPEGIPVGDLPNTLVKLAPKFIVYLISFVVIGGDWGSHQRMLKQIQRGDGLLVWFNLFCLLFIALIPASAALLGRYPDTFLAIVCFALNVVLIQLTTLWLWRHASQMGLIDPRLDPRVIKGIERRLNLSSIIFVLSTPLALWSTGITYLLWVGFFIFLFVTDWLSWEQVGRAQQATIPLDDIKRANVSIQHGDGYLKIDSKTAGHILLEGDFGGGMLSQVERTEDSAVIQLKSPERRGLLNYQYPWSWGPENILDWTLHVSNQIPISLEIETSAGELMLELDPLQITDLKIRTKSSKTDISPPDREGLTKVEVEARSAFITIRVPAEAAAMIRNEMPNGRVEVDPVRFQAIEEERVYGSTNYETAANRVEIRVSGSTSSVEIV